jgi:hypothetical protein
MTDAKNTERWRTAWETVAQEEDYGCDFIGELRNAVGYNGFDPEITQGFAAAAAEAAEATRDALARNWALYTPQQAAVVASSILAQLSAGAAALEFLAQEIEDMERRGDLEAVETPGCDGGNETVPTTVDLVRDVAEEVDVLVERHGNSIVDLMNAIPSKVNLPVDPHDALVRLVALLGDQGRLIERQHQPEQDLVRSYRQGFGCGCELAIDRSDGTWTMHRADSAWSLVAPGEEDENGVIRNWTDLSTTEATPHPAHMLDALWAAFPS